MCNWASKKRRDILTQNSQEWEIRALQKTRAVNLKHILQGQRGQGHGGQCRVHVLVVSLIWKAWTWSFLTRPTCYGRWWELWGGPGGRFGSLGTCPEGMWDADFFHSPLTLQLWGECLPPPRAPVAMCCLTTGPKQWGSLNTDWSLWDFSSF
jgi:hypothetical protein